MLYERTLKLHTHKLRSLFKKSGFTYPEADSPAVTDV